MRKKRISSIRDTNTELNEASDTSADALQDSLIKEIVATRHAKGFVQKQIEAESGVPQAGIYRLERRVTDPQLSTVIRVLRPMGMTLAVVPICAKYK